MKYGDIDHRPQTIECTQLCAPTERDFVNGGLTFLTSDVQLITHTQTPTSLGNVKLFTIKCRSKSGELKHMFNTSYPSLHCGPPKF